MSAVLALALLLAGDAPPIGLEALTNAPPGVVIDADFLRGKTVVLEFWGTWCGGCIVAIPHINALHERFASDDVVFLSVTWEEPELVARFTERVPIAGWIGHDTDRSMVADWEVAEWPTVFVVHDGEILERAFTPDLTAERLATLIETGEPLPPAEPARRSSPLAGGPLRHAIARREGVMPWAVVGGEWIDTHAASLIDEVRVERGTETVTGWKLVPTPGGVELPAGVGEDAGWAIDADARGRPVVVGAAMSLEQIATGIALVTGRPVRAEGDADARYFVNFALRDDPEITRVLLRASCGLDLVPDAFEAEVAIVTRASRR